MKRCLQTVSVKCSLNLTFIGFIHAILIFVAILVTKHSCGQSSVESQNINSLPTALFLRFNLSPLTFDFPGVFNASCLSISLLPLSWMEERQEASKKSTLNGLWLLDVLALQVDTV